MAASGYVIPVNPHELASRVPTHDPWYDEENTFEDDDEEEDGFSEVDEEEMAALVATIDYESQIAPFLDRIPEREADLIYLYFIQHKRQADIATIFGVTQAAISYRLDRGIKRIKFLLDIPQVTEDDLRADLPEVFPDSMDIDILVGMWKTTCQSEVASQLRLTQGRVRHRFFKAVRVLQEAAEQNERLKPYSQIFSKISSKRFNILREVKLPQWSNRGGDECL
jgi:DNA-directed RNA polymerase specialized sigma24 family protein